MSASPVSVRRFGTQALCVHDWIEVRSREEILATLDERGQLDGLPFMPEMFAYCGKRYEVFRVAHKTCDTVTKTGGRRLEDTVHLGELRCDGTSHGGCEAACLIFWKERWLRRVEGPNSPGDDSRPPFQSSAEDEPLKCSEEDLRAAVFAPGAADDSEPTYSCQATLLPEYTTHLKWWDVRQYGRDWRSGNASGREILAGAIYVAVFNVIRRANRPWITLGPSLMRIYDSFQRVVGGVRYPRRWGSIAPGQRTPSPPSLNLRPGDLVRVKSYDEILATLDGNNRNRGMYFDAEEVPYCGGTYRVRSLVTKIIDERSGKMLHLQGNPVILEDVWCKGHYSDRRMFCPRAIYSFWRQAWLERVDDPPRAESAHS